MPKVDDYTPPLLAEIPGGEKRLDNTQRASDSVYRKMKCSRVGGERLTVQGDSEVLAVITTNSHQGVEIPSEVPAVIPRHAHRGVMIPSEEIAVAALNSHRGVAITIGVPEEVPINANRGVALPR